MVVALSVTVATLASALNPSGCRAERNGHYAGLRPGPRLVVEVGEFAEHGLAPSPQMVRHAADGYAVTHSHRRPGAFTRGRHAMPVAPRTVKSVVAGGGVLAGGLVVAAILLVNGSADAGETAAAPTVVPTAAPQTSATSAVPTSEPDATTADGTCISTACESVFQKEFKAGAGNVTDETMGKYLAYAENMCDSLNEGNQAVDLRDSALRYNGFDTLAFTITFASATGTGSLCPAYHDQLVQLRD